MYGYYNQTGMIFCQSNKLRNRENFLQPYIYLITLRLVRRILLKDVIMIEFHGFSDASMTAYVSEIYLKFVTKSGQVFMKLVTCKY